MSDAIKTLYPHANGDEYLEQAHECLLQFGAPWHPSLITSAQGSYITTSTGLRMLDWTSGQMSCLVGHGHPEIVATIKDHAALLDHTFSAMLSPPVIDLARRLTSLLPRGLDKAMFLSTGGESNEAAIRMAKHATGKFEIVALDRSWHGMTGAANAAQYFAGRKGAGPAMPGNLMLAAPNALHSIFRRPDGSHDWQTELDYGFTLVDRASCGSLAAVILEPILSSGGMLELPRGYLRALKTHCEARGMLLIVDEAQTGIGRAGDMFAFMHDWETETNPGQLGIVPDILTLSKTLGNGIPMSAVVASNDVASRSSQNGFMFYTTHLNDPLPAAVGLKVLDIVVRDGLVQKARDLGFKLQQGLQRLRSRYGCIADVRGRGLMAGLEFAVEGQSAEYNVALSNKVSTRMSQLGLWAQLATIAAFGGVFRIAPPITTTEEELKEGLEIMEMAFAGTPGTLPLYSVAQNLERAVL